MKAKCNRLFITHTNQEPTPCRFRPEYLFFFLWLFTAVVIAVDCLERSFVRFSCTEKNAKNFWYRKPTTILHLIPYDKNWSNKNSNIVVYQARARIYLHVRCIIFYCWYTRTPQTRRNAYDGTRPLATLQKT